MNDTKNSLTGTYFAPGPLLTESRRGVPKVEVIKQEEESLLQKFRGMLSQVTIDMENGLLETLLPTDQYDLEIGYADVDAERRSIALRIKESQRKGWF